MSSHADLAALSSAVLSGDGASVQAANGVWAKRGGMGAIKESYVDLVRSVFGAEAAPLGDSFEPINAWVAGKTDGLITDLLQGKPDPLLVAVLVSAVHFRGEWASRFDGALTTAGTFTTAEGAARSVQFMHKTADLAASGGIAALGGAAAVRLDYGTGGSAPADYCAMFVLPAEPGAAPLLATARTMAAAPLGGVLAGLASQKVKLSLPRVKAAYGTRSVKAALRALGIADAFDGKGGFFAMSEDPEVHIDDVLTKAVLEIDEEGTVAAAAAAVMMKRRCLPRPPLALTFDRPFLLAILHVPTGAPLFLARLHEPVQG